MMHRMPIITGATTVIVNQGKGDINSTKL